MNMRCQYIIIPTWVRTTTGVIMTKYMKKNGLA